MNIYLKSNMRLFVFACLTVLLATVSSFRLHEIKISTSEVTITNTTAKIHIKLFADDLASCLSQFTKKHVPFDGTTVDEKTLVALNQYIKRNYALSVNNIPLTYEISNSIIDNNQDEQLKTIELIYVADFKTNVPIKKILLKNTLLFDGIPEQKNITKINILSTKISNTIVIENIKEETQKELSYK